MSESEGDIMYEGESEEGITYASECDEVKMNIRNI